MYSNHTAGAKFAQRDPKSPKIHTNLPSNPTSLHRPLHRRSRLNSSIPTPGGVSQNLDPNILPYLNTKPNPEKYSKPLAIEK